MEQAALLALGLAVDLTLLGLPLFAWWRRGRDRHFTDDDSVLMPSPPSDFTPALATVVMQGQPSRHTVSAALMYLVSQNLITLQTEPSHIGERAGIRLTPHRPRRLHIPEPEEAFYTAIRNLAGRSGHIPSVALGSLNGACYDLCRALDEIAWQRGWVRARPDVVIHRWRILASVEVIVGLFIAGWISRLLPLPIAIAVAIIGMGLVAAGAITFLVSGAMPARTREGAELAAMLNAYRRTLEATIAQAHSLEEVVVMAPLPWVGTPEEELAWAVAFDLDRQIDGLLTGSLHWAGVGGWSKSIREWFADLY